MKLPNTFLCLFACAFVLVNCKNDSHAFFQSDQQELIKTVETNLSFANRLKDEPTWTITERMEHYGVPGMSLAVIKDNKVIWTKAYGVKDRDTNQPVTTDTLFQCASISKPLSSAAALAMSEKNSLDLDANVNQYLTSWKLPDNAFTKQKKVSIKHLISHTGGVTVHGFRGYTTEEDVPTLIELLSGTAPSNSPPVRVDKEPGGEFRYSGGGYCILQQLMIDQTGEAFPTIMQKFVLTPLGMTKSTYEQPLPTDRINEAATGHFPNGQMVTGKQHIYPEMSPAGLWSTSEELARFIIELQLSYKGESSKVFSSKMARQMLDEDLGIFVRGKGDDKYFGHGGWNEGFSSEARAHLAKGYGVVVLTNSNHPQFVEEVINSVANTYQWANASNEYSPLPITAEELKEIVGRYDRDGELINVSPNGEKLFYSEYGQTPLEMFKVAENKFVRKERPHAVCFSKNSNTGQTQFAFQLPGETASDVEIAAYKMASDQKLPIEWIDAGDFEKAKEAYLAVQKKSPKSPSLDEEALNDLGYSFLGTNELKKAILVFRIITLLYPNSANAWDSLGEGYMNNGQLEPSIRNYQKSLELNPDNPAARKLLKKMQAKLGAIQ